MSDQETYPCGRCHLPVLTYWDERGKGLLTGQYILAGDVIFHPECWDQCLKEFPPDGQLDSARDQASGGAAPVVGSTPGEEDSGSETGEGCPF